jgi:phosphoglucomutase
MFVLLYVEKMTAFVGSVGATIRIYMERYESRPDSIDLHPMVALSPLIKVALSLSDIASITKRDAPTVIT